MSWRRYGEHSEIGINGKFTLSNQYRIGQQVRKLGQLVTQRRHDIGEIHRRTTEIGRSVLAASRVMKSANFYVDHCS